MVVIEQVNPAEYCGRLAELYYLHGREVVGEDFNLNFTHFADAFRSGAYRLFVARDGYNNVGYCVFSVYNDLLMRHKRTAECGAIYVKPEYRLRHAVRLIKFAELSLQAEGINRVLVHSPSDRLAKLYDKLGYKHLEAVQLKEF